MAPKQIFLSLMLVSSDPFVSAFFLGRGEERGELSLPTPVSTNLRFSLGY